MGKKSKCKKKFKMLRNYQEKITKGKNFKISRYLCMLEKFQSLKNSKRPKIARKKSEYQRIFRKRNKN